MSWIKTGQFRLVTNRPGKKYIFRRANNGNSEYNVPNSVKTRKDAIAWLLSKRNLKPNRFRGARKKVNAPFISAFSNFKLKSNKVNLPYHPGYVPGSPQYSGVYSCSSGKGLKLLGKGRQGIVFKGNGFAAKVCPRDLAAAHRKEKQPALAEYDIQTAVFKACPGGVVEPYEHLKCIDFIAPSTMNMQNVQNSRKYDKSKQSIIFMELCEGGSLENWLKEKGKTDAILQNLISSIIKTLGQIYKKYPDFRHNDLWPANIMVSKRGFLIGDFGWARLKKTGTNPAVNTANGTNTAEKWGVGPKTDLRYDYHFFLNNIGDFVKRAGGMPKTQAFLEWAVPIGYRGPTNLHVNEWRLKYDDPCPDLPSFAEVLRSKYISGRKVTSPNLVEARARLKPVKRRPRITSVNLLLGRARLRKVKASPLVTSAKLRSSRARLKKAFPRRAIRLHSSGPPKKDSSPGARPRASLLQCLKVKTLINSLNITGKIMEPSLGKILKTLGMQQDARRYGSQNYK
jgi:serine/threonine protein kinase